MSVQKQLANNQHLLYDMKIGNSFVYHLQSSTELGKDLPLASVSLNPYDND